MTDLYAVQAQLETDAVEAARRLYRERVASQPLADLPPGLALVRRNIHAVSERISRWADDATNGKAGRGVGVARFVAQFDPEEVAFVTLRVCLRMDAAGAHSRSMMSTYGGSSLVRVANEIVSTLEAVDLEQRLKESDPAAFARYCKRRDARSQRTAGGQRRVMILLRKSAQAASAFPEAVWGPSERTQVGVRLVEIVAEETGLITIDALSPFSAARRGQGYQNATSRMHAAYTVQLSPAATEWVEAAHASFEMAAPQFLPMVVPPVPWTSTTQGGYLSNTAGFRRPLIKVNAQAFLSEAAHFDFPEVLAAVNALQETRWRINADVLAVLQKTTADGSVTGLPGAKAEDIADVERLPFMDLPRESWTEEQQAEFRAWKQRRAQVRDRIADNVVRSADTRRKLAVAEKMAPFDAIYFPHQLDFRGRAYPMPLFVNPQGDDLSKSLLTFADARPLGPHGMSWLVIHGANTFGVDKVSFAERAGWVKQNLAGILASAEDPLAPGALWVSADSPWQFLAFCCEWARLAAHLSAGKPAEEFLSSLPVSLDGTCNGLQHFAAMLRDRASAEAVNLAAMDSPQDVYARVAEVVRKRVESDLASDDPDTVTFAKAWLAVGINRKTAKRGTMTTPYGVSRFGMGQQLWGELSREQLEALFAEVDAGKRGACVQYLAGHLWSAVAEVVAAARGAMDWLRAVAKQSSEIEIEGADARGIALWWTTADGLPIQQAYRRVETLRFEILGCKYKLSYRQVVDGIDTRKQMSAISPNFVHSVDAAHMRLVVRRLSKMGLRSFAMVHDSFGTHAGDVETLARVTREEFVALHSTDVLGKFAEEVERLIGDPLPPLPPKGDFDLSEVLRSDYFFA